MKSLREYSHFYVFFVPCKQLHLLHRQLHMYICTCITVEIVMSTVHYYLAVIGHQLVSQHAETYMQYKRQAKFYWHYNLLLTMYTVIPKSYIQYLQLVAVHVSCNILILKGFTCSSVYIIIFMVWFVLKYVASYPKLTWYEKIDSNGS